MASRWYPEGTTYPTLAPIYYAQGQQSLNSSSRDSSRQAGVPMSMTHARIYGHPKLYIHPTNAAPQKLIPRNGALVSDQEPEFTDGVDYFKIGDIVRVRRYKPVSDSYNLWVYGKVIRPILAPSPNGGGDVRCYSVSYFDPHACLRKEATFAPHLKEIAPSMSLDRNENVVFGLLPLTGAKKIMIWTPVALSSKPCDKPALVRVLLGPYVNSEVAGVRDIVAYNVKVASMLRGQGMLVEGDGTQRFV